MAQQAAVICGVLLCVLLIIAALSGSPAVSAALSAVGVIGSVIVFLIPGGIVSMCMMDTMRCHAVMKPFVRIMSVLIALCALINLILALRSRPKKV